MACARSESAPARAILSRVDIVPPGVECSSGGKAVRTGVDVNGDDVLEDAEVSETTLLCDDPARTLLVRADAEPPGANCPSGGTAVRAGLDTNGNGVLDDAEVERVAFVCGAAATAPPPILTRSAAEPAGSHCVNGGTRVDAGRDEDDDGVLSDAEVEQTIFVCAPTPQPPNPVLVRRDPAPSGACAGAGTTVSAGIDADGDGVLSDAEVTQTTTVCSETIFTFTVRNAADLELLSRATRVAGSLVVSGSDLESAYIPVQVVDGSIAVESNPKLASITLMPQLVGGGIAVRHNPLLTFVAVGGVLGKPKQLSGSLELVDDPVLTTVAGLDALSVVGGNLVLDGTGMPLVPELDVLAYVGGNVVIANNPALLWWPPSPLIDVRGYVLLQANPSFAQYPDSLPFSSIAGMLTVADDGLGGILKLGEVRYVAAITVSNNARLVDVEFPFLASIDGDLTIVDNYVLDLGYGINHVRSIAGSVLVARNANLTTFGTLFDLTTVSADVVMTDNPKLQYLWTDDLASARDVVIARNAALTTLGGFGTTANLAGLAHVESLDVEANPVLAHLVIPGLTYASLLTVKDNTLLSTCDALALAAQVTAPPGHTVVITGNAGDGSGCP